MVDAALVDEVDVTLVDEVDVGLVEVEVVEDEVLTEDVVTETGGWPPWSLRTHPEMFVMAAGHATLNA